MNAKPLLFEQYQKMHALTKIFVIAMDAGLEQVAWDIFPYLQEIGIPHELRNGKIHVSLEGQDYFLQIPKQKNKKSVTACQTVGDMDYIRVPAVENRETESELYREETDDWGKPKEQNKPKADPLSDFDKELEALSQEYLTAEQKEKTPAFGHACGAAADASFAKQEPDPPESQRIAPENSDFLRALDELNTQVGFGRSDASGPPDRRYTTKKEEVAQVDAVSGFQPPLTSDFTPNYEIAMKDCIYSMFYGEIYEETSLRKHKIYFMTAPFEVTDNIPSANILLYAYFNGENYAVTSLNNPDKNSLLCQIDKYQFLVRGKFQDGKWSAQIQLAGNSLRRKDVFDIKKTYHNNPDTVGQTNGHIRFRYQGYINRKELISTGCVNIFPVDVNSGVFVIVRCMEDFTDIFYTDDVDHVTLYTTEGKKDLTVRMENQMAYAALTDTPEAEESEFHE